MHTSIHRPGIEELRARIRRLESTSGRRRSVLPFGIKELDRHLPGGGLALGALHEVAGGGDDTIHGAAAALFAAGIAARTRGKVLWCLTRPDLFAPAIRRFLLHFLPHGFHRIRHCGLLASSTRKVNIAHARELLAVAPAPPEPVEAPEPLDWLPPCPCCGGRMRIIETFERWM